MATKAVSCTTAPLTTRQAAAAIVKLINARPISRRQDEIEAIIARAAGGPALPAAMTLSEKQTQLHEAIREYLAAERAFGEASLACLDKEDPQQHDAIQARFEGSLDRVGELADQLPSPARSITDVILRAGVAYCYADKTDDHRDIEPGGAEEETATRLIRAVLEYADINY